MTVNKNFPTAPENHNLSTDYLRLLKLAVNSAMRGKINAGGELTLDAGAASTVKADNRCLASSIILLMPITANAAAALAGVYITTVAGSFTINHANNAQTDRNFKYVIIG